MIKANQTIREAAKKADLPYWRIADALGISEITLCRWLRKPLAAEKEANILQVIQMVKDGEKK